MPKSRSRSSSDKRSHKYKKDKHNSKPLNSRCHSKHKNRNESRRKHTRQKKREPSRKSYEKRCVDKKRIKRHELYSSSTSSSRSSSSSSLQPSSESSVSGEDASHLKYQKGQLFKDGKYEITKFICDGTFGRVVEVKNHYDNKLYAMKIIRAVKRYVESAKTEEYILRYLAARDPKGDSKLIRLYEAFQKKEQQTYQKIKQQLGPSLYELLKMNNFQGFPIKYVQSFFRQILQATSFMHCLMITHTDLKPENILVSSNTLIKTKINAPSNTSTTMNTKYFHLPSTDEIKIIDVGGATFDYDHHSAIVNTRQYRAPEIILGCQKWDSSSDLWSIACIILEIYTGQLYFQTRKSDLEHLAMIEKACGHIPSWMAVRSSPPLNAQFRVDQEHLHKYKTYFIHTHTDATPESIGRIDKIRTIDECVREAELADLLKKILVIEPQKRINCTTALKHPFFQIKYD